MSAREVRIASDQRLPAAPADRTIAEDAWQLQRQAIEAHARARERPSAVTPPSAAAIRPPALVLDPAKSFDFPRGSRREVISPVNVYRRLENLERLAHLDGVRVAAVWALLHESEHPINGAVVNDEHGRAHIFVITNRSRCPLLRLHTYRHEARHLDRLVDLSHCGEAEYFEAERDCNEAAAAYVRDYVEIANMRSSCPIDAEECIACATGSRKPCRQGAEVYEQVSTILGAF